ncbi:hypothetical protein NQ317_017033 [Molorchus minor]|uniref:Uncharacterized protein n=1 Tax=Molorchus minor TaxID=1323400 RepID=A0ABQ9K5V4_9CUCU|nr:hypothetical protein NQ317_017033 [Molorchus minor]
MAAKDFVKAQSDNLPNVDSFMLMEFIRSNDCFNAAEIRGVKAQSLNEKNIKRKNTCEKPMPSLNASLTRFAKFMNESDQSSSKFIAELQIRLKKAEGLFEEFNIIQSQIELLDTESDYSEDRESFENSYFDVISSGGW